MRIFDFFFSEENLFIYFIVELKIREKASRDRGGEKETTLLLERDMAMSCDTFKDSDVWLTFFCEMVVEGF